MSLLDLLKGLGGPKAAKPSPAGIPGSGRRCSCAEQPGAHKASAHWRRPEPDGTYRGRSYKRDADGAARRLK